MKQNKKVKKNCPLAVRRFSAAVAAACFFLVLSTTATAKSALCADILYLIEQSGSGFFALQDGPDSEFGDYRSAFVLPRAWYCVIDEDAEKRAYRCTWKYPYQDGQAYRAFQRLLQEVRECVGDDAEEYQGKPVNHPDSYTSHHFRLRGTEARVSLKNKIALKSKLVSIVIDAAGKR